MDKWQYLENHVVSHSATITELVGSLVQESIAKKSYSLVELSLVTAVCWGEQKINIFPIYLLYVVSQHTVLLFFLSRRNIYSMGAFNNYVDKKGGGGISKKSTLVHPGGAKGGGGPVRIIGTLE